MKASGTNSTDPYGDDIYKEARGRYLLEVTRYAKEIRSGPLLTLRLAACDSGIDYRSVMLAKVLRNLAEIDTADHVEAAIAAMGSELLDPQSLTEIDLENMKAPSKNELPASDGTICKSSSEWISLVNVYGHAFGHEFKEALQNEEKQRQQKAKGLKKRLCEAVDYLFETLERGKGFIPHGNALLVKVSDKQYRPLSSATLLAYQEVANALGRIPSSKELREGVKSKYGDATYQKKKSNTASEFQSGPKISKLPNRTWTKILDKAGISVPKKPKKKIKRKSEA